MKIGFKFCVVLAGAALILTISYHTLFVNISKLLAVERPSWSYHAVPSGVTVKIGPWKETVYYLPQLKMSFQNQLCTISGRAGSLIIGLPPNMQLKWKKTLNSGRKSRTGGE